MQSFDKSTAKLAGVCGQDTRLILFVYSPIENAVPNGEPNMDASNHLFTITEIAVALAGFAGVVASFQNNPSASISRGSVLGLAIMINMSLAVAFFSLLPFALFNFGLEERAVWGISSGLYTVNYCVFAFDMLRKLRKLSVRRRSTRLFFGLLAVSSISAIVIIFLNTVGVIFHQEFGPYFITLVFPLIFSGYMFMRLVIRPLWQTVREAEAVSQPDPRPS